jgi:transposase
VNEASRDTSVAGTSGTSGAEEVPLALQRELDRMRAANPFEVLALGYDATPADIRAEAEAIYDAGREACVDVLVALARQVERLERRVERLEEELRRNSDNSSVPPSADPGAGKRRRRAKPSGRPPGGQPGHPGAGRRLFSPQRVDEVARHLPERCAGCGVRVVPHQPLRQRLAVEAPHEEELRVQRVVAEEKWFRRRHSGIERRAQESELHRSRHAFGAAGAVALQDQR